MKKLLLATLILTSCSTKQTDYEVISDSLVANHQFDSITDYQQYEFDSIIKADTLNFDLYE